MSVLVDGVAYRTAEDVAREAGVTRQTFWRWRKLRKVPQGRRFRDGQQLLFTADEVRRVVEFANRMEPVVAAGIRPPGRSVPGHAR